MLGVLIAEDDPVQRVLVRRVLEDELPVEITEVADGESALRELKAERDIPIALALIDLGMPKLSGMDLLRSMNEAGSSVRAMVITGSEAIEDAVEAMRLGAVDFISKPVQRERLLASARNALVLHELQVEVSRLKEDREPTYGFEALLNVCPGLEAAVALGRKAVRSEIPVLITGESGVGKEVFARAIHRESARHDKPLVAVNCGALPDNLVESTLFGHEKGAFTGALQRSIGKCREAEGGVLFLDEIGDLKPETQVKLLRLLQEGEIEPVGSSKTVNVNVRVISATNHSLEQAVAEGRFREDLFYRLQGFPIHLPALRERRGDIVPLANHLLKRIAMSEGRKALTLSPDAQKWLTQQPWAGNVRELQHLLHRTCLMADTDTLQEVDFTRWGARRAKMESESPEGLKLSLLDTHGRPRALEEMEQEIFTRMVEFHDGHIGKTAAALGIGQSTLYKRIKPAS